MSEPQVVIVGAGMAGLTAAYFLKQKGVDVVVLEASDRVGGRMLSTRQNGFLIDGGAQFLSSSYGVVPKLIQRLGLQRELVEVSPYSAIVREGRPRRIKAADPFSLVSSGVLSIGAFSHFAYTIGLERIKTAALPLEDYSAWYQLDEGDAQEWSMKNLSEEVYNYLIEPTFEGLYFQSPAGSSRAFGTAVSMFPARGQTIYSLTGGNASLTAAMAELVNVKTGCRVTAVNQEHSSVEVVTEAGEHYKTKSAILATTSSRALRLFQSAGDIERRLMGTKYSATVNIVYGVAKSPEGMASQGIYGVWIPKAERQNIAAIAIESNKKRKQAGEGEVINVMLSGESGLKFVDKSDEEILEAVTPEVDRYFPNLSKSLAFTKIFRWTEAEPLSPVGRSRDLQAYRSAKEPRQIYLAGDYMSMPWSDGAAESGMWAAKQILSQLSR